MANMGLQTLLVVHPYNHIINSIIVARVGFPVANGACRLWERAIPFVAFRPRMYHFAELCFPSRSPIEENKSSTKSFQSSSSPKNPPKKSILMVVLFSFLDPKQNKKKGVGTCVYINVLLVWRFLFLNIKQRKGKEKKKKTRKKGEWRFLVRGGIVDQFFLGGNTWAYALSWAPLRRKSLLIRIHKVVGDRKAFTFQERKQIYRFPFVLLGTIYIYICDCFPPPSSRPRPRPLAPAQHSIPGISLLSLAGNPLVHTYVLAALLMLRLQGIVHS